MQLCVCSLSQLTYLDLSKASLINLNLPEGYWQTMRKLRLQDVSITKYWLNAYFAQASHLTSLQLDGGQLRGQDILRLPATLR